MNVLQKFQRWLFISFPPNGTRKPKERELALLYKTFSTQVGWYNPFANTLGEPFMNELALLQKQVSAIYLELHFSGAKDIPSTKGKREEEELAWFSQLLLHLIFQTHDFTEESFTFTQIRKTIDEQDPINLQQSRERFHHLIKLSGLDHLKPWQDTLLFFWVIYSLMSLDWRLLSYNGKPRDGFEMLQSLEDIYFVSCQMADHSQWVLPEAIRPLQPQFQIAWEIIKKMNQWLPNLLKCLKNDSSFKPKTIHLTGEVFHNWVQELHHSFESDLVEYRQAQDELRITKLVEKLFPSGGLQEFPIYNSETQEIFRSGNFQGLTQVYLAGILYSFWIAYSHDKIKPCIQGLALHGAFVSEVARKQFIDTTDKFDGMNQQLVDLVEEFSSPSQSVLLQALNLLKTPILDEQSKKSIRNAQQESNKKINQLAKDALVSAKSLLVLLETCDRDVTSPRPQYFDSLPGLRRHHPEIFEHLNPSIHSVQTLVEILSVFVPEADSSRVFL